jgi:hypothetical protein
MADGCSQMDTIADVAPSGDGCAESLAMDELGFEIEGAVPSPSHP